MMSKQYFVILIPVISIVISCPTYKDETLLQATLLSNYNKGVRPVIDLSTTINIEAALFLHTFYGLDFVNNIVTARYDFSLEWTDELLTWNPLDYNNITVIYIEKDKLWTPEIVMCNAMKESEEKGSFLEVKVFNNGRVQMRSLKLLKSYCTFDAYAYPFDQHDCEIYICVALHDPVHTRIRTLTYDNLNYSPNYNWDIDYNGIKNASDQRFSVVFAPLHLRRRLTIAIVAMLIPTIMMTILTIFVFLLPPESGEKVSLATTIFLSNVLYLVEIEKTTPRNSKFPPLLMTYLMLLSLLSGIATLGSVIICKLYVIQSSDEKTSNLPDQTTNKSRSNKIADSSTITTRENDPVTLNSKSNTKTKFCITEYFRLDETFLKISIITTVIISILFTSFLCTQ
ncbi:neuronal acetylcholine receptor subunit beta-3 [Octopus bimaculoides]|nr:neuronal acetylcholine receptor subunit beta-3 [Octopus bimaculoides]|eukprot:XP_014772640.1 PREDICTED: neuronal acetylcholine receptor subunit beta-3-like [Octopus bimaculoides]